MTTVSSRRCVVPELFGGKRSVLVKPFVLPGVVSVVFRTPQSEYDSVFIRTVLESVPGRIEVVEHGLRSFRVIVDDTDEALLAAQCYIEREFGLPHRFACEWYEVRRVELYVTRATSFDGFLFLEPVAQSMASTLLARMKQLQVEGELLYADSHRVLFRLTYDIPARHRYSDYEIKTDIQIDGVVSVDEAEWDPAWPPERLLDRMKRF